jgi:hypothetical protein
MLSLSGRGNRTFVGNSLACAALAVFVSVVAAVACAPAARAGLIDLTACNSSSLSQPFAPWGDFSEYELGPDGNFESGPWNLAGGAQVVPGGEPFAATGTLSSSSLSLPAGASAVSPPTCMDAAYPTLRMFIGGVGVVEINVVADGLVIPAGVAVGVGGWQPTPVMVTSAALLGALSGGTAQVSLQVVGLAGDPEVDDVFIDPWNRGG